MEANFKRYKDCNQNFPIQLFCKIKLKHVKFIMWFMMAISSFILFSEATESTEKFLEGEPVQYYSPKMRQYFKGFVTTIDPFTMKGHDNCFYSLTKKRNLDNGIAAWDKAGSIFYMEKNMDKNIEKISKLIQAEHKSDDIIIRDEEEIQFEENVFLDNEEEHDLSPTKKFNKVMQMLLPHKGFGSIKSTQETQNITTPEFSNMTPNNKVIPIGMCSLSATLLEMCSSLATKKVDKKQPTDTNRLYYMEKNKNKIVRNASKILQSGHKAADDIIYDKEEIQFEPNVLLDNEEESNLSPAKQFTGVIQAFISDRGFGFIKSNQETQTIFVHISDVIEKRKELNIGENVKFDIEYLEMGRSIAKNVSGDHSGTPNAQYDYLQNEKYTESKNYGITKFRYVTFDGILNLYGWNAAELEDLEIEFLSLLKEITIELDSMLTFTLESETDEQFYQILKKRIIYTQPELDNITATKLIRYLCSIITTYLENTNTFRRLNILECIFEDKLENVLQACDQESYETLKVNIAQTRENFGVVDEFLMPFYEGDRLLVVTAFDKFKPGHYNIVTDNYGIRQKFEPGFRRGTIEVIDGTGKVRIIQASYFDKLKIFYQEKRTRGHKNKKKLEYKGSINQKGQWHGYGVLECRRFFETSDDDGFGIISGQWRNNIASGVMTLLAHENRYKYEGELNENLEFHGQGKLTLIDAIGNNKTTEGKWRNGFCHGNIKRTEVTGEQIEGKFENGRKVGRFSHFFPGCGQGYVIQYPYGYYYQYQESISGRNYVSDGYKLSTSTYIVDLEERHVEKLSFEELKIAFIYRKQIIPSEKNKQHDALKKILRKEE